jgi:hypothetical protein
MASYGLLADGCGPPFAAVLACPTRIMASSRPESVLRITGAE